MKKTIVIYKVIPAICIVILAVLIFNKNIIIDINLYDTYIVLDIIFLLKIIFIIILILIGATFIKYKHFNGTKFPQG